MEKEAKTEIFTVLLEKLVVRLESMRIAEYMELLEHPGKLILINFIFITLNFWSDYADLKT